MKRRLSDDDGSSSPTKRPHPTSPPPPAPAASRPTFLFKWIRDEEYATTMRLHVHLGPGYLDKFPQSRFYRAWTTAPMGSPRDDRPPIVRIDMTRLESGGPAWRVPQFMTSEHREFADPALAQRRVHVELDQFYVHAHNHYLTRRGHLMEWTQVRHDVPDPTPPNPGWRRVDTLMTDEERTFFRGLGRVFLCGALEAFGLGDAETLGVHAEGGPGLVRMYQSLGFRLCSSPDRDEAYVRAASEDTPYPDICLVARVRELRAVCRQNVRAFDPDVSEAFVRRDGFGGDGQQGGGGSATATMASSDPSEW